MDYNKLPKLPLMTAEEERTATRDELVIRNLRLAFHQARKFAGRLMDSEDLQQIAIEALTVAAVRFDRERGVRFSTFATHRVKHALHREVMRSDQVHPGLRSQEYGFKERVGFEPVATTEEVGFLDPPSNEMPPDEAAQANRDRDKALKALGVLSERERDIINKYYGFGGEFPMSDAKIAKEQKVSRPRIAWIRARAEKKMIEGYRSNKLRNN